MNACYCRVSTARQDLSRQVNRTLEYTSQNLGTELPETVSVAEVAESAENERISSPAEFGEVRVYFDKSTGTNTNRDGFTELMDDVAAGDVESVVVNSVSRLARSIRDLENTTERIVEENEASLYIVSEGMELNPQQNNPYQRALFQMLGMFAELEAKMTRQRIQEGIQSRMENDDYHHGPAPLGFEKDEGRLIEAPNYDQVIAVLDMVQSDELSKRKAAKELGCARSTIGRALDRGGLYGL